MAQNRPCPSCRAQGRDKTGNHLYLMEDGETWNCTRCGYRVKEIDLEEEEDYKVSANNHKDIQFVSDYPTRPLYRGIRPEISEKFGVKGKDNTSYYPVYKAGKLTGYKLRKHPKEFRSLGDCSGDTQLFGISNYGKYLVITGGEEDAMAAYQMFVDYNPAYNYSVMSVVHGEQAVKDIANNIKDIQRYDNVVLCFDNDGKTKVDEMAALIGAKCKVMAIPKPYKDANDMLLAGQGKAFISAFFNAKGYVPDGFVSVEDVYEEAIQPPSYGRLFPWPTLNKLTFGRRNGEGIYVGAGVKAGKSEWLNEMVEHIIKEEGGKVLLFKFEESPSLTVRKLAGKMEGKVFHRPDIACTPEEIAVGVEKVKDKLFMYGNAQCATGDTDLWERIKAAIRYAVVAEGVQDVFLDPITNLTDGLSSSETDAALRKISNELAGLAQELGFFYYCFCHLKAPATGVPHEEGGKVHSNQFRGSRAMMEKTNFMLGIERNKLAEDEQEKNTSRFVLLENRLFGFTGSFEVMYNHTTGSYREKQQREEF